MCVCVCITLICECYMNVSFHLWMLYHLCVLYSIHLCFYLAINTFSLSLSLSYPIWILWLIQWMTCGLQSVYYLHVYVSLWRRNPRVNFIGAPHVRHTAKITEYYTVKFAVNQNIGTYTHPFGLCLTNRQQKEMRHSTSKKVYRVHVVYFINIFCYFVGTGPNISR